MCSLGNVAPAPPEEWLAWSRKVEARLAGQLALRHEPDVDAAVERIQTKGAARTTTQADGNVVAVCTDQATVEDARERHSRVARNCNIAYDAAAGALI